VRSEPSEERPLAVGRQAAIYGASNIAVRAIAFLLLPVYTRLLSPEEFGIWGVALAAGSFFSIVLLFGIEVPVSRLYFDPQDEAERRRTYGTLLVFQLLGALLFAAAIDLGLGRWDLFAHVPSRPYLRLALWTAYLLNLNLIPLALMRVRQQAGRHALVVTAAGLVSSLAPVAALLAGWRSAAGVLVGSLLGAVLMAAVYLYLVLPDVSIAFSWRTLAKTLAYSLQFVPHSLAGWALNLSDRLVLERLMTLERVGVYTVGYTLAAGFLLIVEGAGQSWLPFFLRYEHEKPDRPRVILYTTYFVAALSYVALAVALLGPLFVRLLLPAEYAATEAVVVWATMGFLFFALYLIFGLTTMSLKRLTALPLLTVLAAAVNVALNFALVPRWGILAAAITTAVSYALLALASFFLARRLYPVAHDYRRWWTAMAATFALTLLASIVTLPLPLDVGWRLILLAIGWPLCLLAARFFSAGEIEQIRSAVERRWRKATAWRRR
jgi:O-antigen/teichoic acid export membrane protein